MLNEFHWCKQNYLIQERIRIYSVLSEVYNKYVKKIRKNNNNSVLNKEKNCACVLRKPILLY